MDYFWANENSLGISSEKIMMPMQPGDVVKTWAIEDDLICDYDYRPNTPINEGTGKFVEWYKNFYKD